ncbi:MAG: hypothetical protein KKB31_01930, partial [Nanoarchaeota archaeon]|nr:hypothetical protein [Nanoarchaeota archaeon]
VKGILEIYSKKGNIGEVNLFGFNLGIVNYSYFKENDVEKIKEFLEDELHISVHIERESNREFKHTPALWKKNMVRDIDWTNPKNIIILLKNEDKTDNQMLELLGVPDRESNFVVVTRMRSVRQKFKSWAKELGLDDSLEEHIEKFAKLYSSQQRKTEKQIINIIKIMIKKGCNILSKEQQECSDGFNTHCLNCEYNKDKEYIKDEGDIDRFNRGLKSIFTEK